MPGGDASEGGPISAEGVLDALGGPGGPLAHVEVHGTVGSTNALALEDGREALLVVAREQTGGRGRHGSSWASPPGGLYMSYVPPAALVPDRPTDVPLLAALAVAGAVEGALDDGGSSAPSALIKWPNDVLVGDGKVAGVLVQSSALAGTGPRIVVGVGVNVNATVRLEEERTPEEWPVGPRSLSELSGGPLALQPLLVDLLLRLMGRLEAGLTTAAVAEYRSRCHTLGRRVAFTEGGRRLTGTAVDVTPDGRALQVRLEGGDVVEVTAGEVRHLRAVQG